METYELTEHEDGNNVIMVDGLPISKGPEDEQVCVSNKSFIKIFMRHHFVIKRDTHMSLSTVNKRPSSQSCN